MSRTCRALAALMLAIGGEAVAQASAPGELARLVGLYRSGSVAAAIEGLQALVRATPSGMARAEAELHLGLALRRVRPAEAIPLVRGAISADPDVALTGTEVPADDAALFDAIRRDLPVPDSLTVGVTGGVVGLGEPTTLRLHVRDASRWSAATFRMSAARPGTTDTVPLAAGRVGDEISWDGRIVGQLAPAGAMAIRVEVSDPASGATVTWRRSLTVSYVPLGVALDVPPRPVATRTVDTLRVLDQDHRRDRLRSGTRIAVIGAAASGLASGLADPVADRTAPRSAARGGVAVVGVAGLAGALLGAWRLYDGLFRPREALVAVPDEAALRRQRAIDERWRLDAARVAEINADPASARRLVVFPGGRLP